MNDFSNRIRRLWRKSLLSGSFLLILFPDTTVFEYSYSILVQRLVLQGSQNNAFLGTWVNTKRIDWHIELLKFAVK